MADKDEVTTGDDGLERAAGGRSAIADASANLMKSLVDAGGDGKNWDSVGAKGKEADAEGGDDDDAPDGEDGADEGDGEESPYLEDGEEGDGEGEGDEKPETDETEKKVAATDEKKAGTKDAGEKKDGDDAPEPQMLVLKGLEERGEQDLELDVTDLPKEHVERLRRLQNDAMRGSVYKERITDVERREQTMEEITLQAETNPAGFALEVIPEKHRLTVAKALMVECWEQLQEDLKGFYEDPAAIPKEQARVAKAAREGDRETADRRARVDYARSLKNAITELVPEGTAHEIHAQFIRDAQQDVLALIREGKAVTPKDVPALLVRRLTLYGFGAKDAKAVAAAVARPVSDRAKAIATKAAQVKGTQDRIKDAQTRRSNASGIAPGGRGAAAARKPVVPKGADIEKTSKALLKAGAADSWEDFAARTG